MSASDPSANQFAALARKTKRRFADDEIEDLAPVSLVSGAASSGSGIPDWTATFQVQLLAGISGKIMAELAPIRESIQRMNERVEKLEERVSRLEARPPSPPLGAFVGGSVWSAGSLASIGSPAGPSAQTAASKVWHPSFVLIRGFADYGVRNQGVTREEATVLTEALKDMLPMVLRPKVGIFQLTRTRNHEIKIPIADHTVISEIRGLWSDALRDDADLSYFGRQLYCVPEREPSWKPAYRACGSAKGVVEALCPSDGSLSVKALWPFSISVTIRGGLEHRVATIHRNGTTEWIEDGCRSALHKTVAEMQALTR